MVSRQEDVPKGVLGVVRYVSRGGDIAPHKEQTDSQIVVGHLEEKVEWLEHLPKRQLRAIIALLDLRILNYNTALTMATDGITVSRLQGRSMEVSELQRIFRVLLDAKLAEPSAD